MFHFLQGTYLDPASRGSMDSTSPLLEYLKAWYKEWNANFVNGSVDPHLDTKNHSRASKLSPKAILSSSPIFSFEKKSHFILLASCVMSCLRRYKNAIVNSCLRSVSLNQIISVNKWQFTSVVGFFHKSLCLFNKT